MSGVRTPTSTRSILEIQSDGRWSDCSGGRYMRNCVSVPSLLLFSGACAWAATSNIPQNPIPVNDPLTIAKCGGCHKTSENGVMRRISSMRTTPEVWQQAIKRMMRLHGVHVTAEEASHIVRYLSANNGLAPEEAKPIFWEAEHRLMRDQEDPAYVPAALQRTCNTCHTIGRVLSQRRTREDYQKLANMHVGLFPYTDIMVFRPYPPSASLAEMPVTTTAVGSYDTVLNYPKEPDTPGKAPIDVALDYLADPTTVDHTYLVRMESRHADPQTGGNLVGGWLSERQRPGFRAIVD